MLAVQFQTLRVALAPENVRASIGAHLKLPLGLAGLGLGLLATRPSRALRLLAAGASLWKMARKFAGIGAK